MSDFKIPELPSDEELGIAGLSEEDLKEGPPQGGGDDGGEGPPPGKEPAAGKTPGKGRPSLPWRGWATLAVLLAGAWLSSSHRALPSPRAATAPDTAFASGRALVTLAEMARRPHPTGSPEHDRVRELLLTRLRELGLEPEIQEVTQVIARRDQARAATVRNILARIPGSESTGSVLLTAHYDAVPGSPGAGDDATGVVTVLETVRALQAGRALRNDVIVLLSDAEELGLLGARAFVGRHPWMAQVRMVLSVEMRGAGGPSIMFETGAENGWVVERLRATDPHPVANSVSNEVYRRIPNDTDFSPFRDAGVQGVNFAAIGRAERYHQPTDTPGNLQESTVQHHGERLLSLVRAMGNDDLSEVRERDRSFTVLPFLGMVTLPVGQAIPITLGLLFALLVVTFLASLRGTRARGFLLAAILSAASMGLSAAAGAAILRWMVSRLPGWETGAMVTAAQGEGIYFLALAALALGITTTVFSLGHRWMTPLEATLGALLIPVLGLVAATLMAPAAALNLQGPMASTLVLLALLTGVGLHRARGTVAWVASVLLALPVLAFLVPVQELVAVALTFNAAPLLGALFAFTLLFILPALSALDYPNRWWAPALAFLTAASLLGVGWLRAGPSGERPAPSTLLYAMERDARGIPTLARWGSRDGPGLAWAQGAVGSEFTDTLDLDPFGIPGRSYRAAEAPLAAVPAPEVSVLADTVVAGERRVRLGIRSAIGAEMVRITLPEGLEFAGVDGAGTGMLESEPFTPAVRSLEHWGRPAGRVEIELTGTPTADWTVEVVEHHLRPQELLEVDRFQRPESLMANTAAFSDRALFRTPFTVPARGAGETSPAGGAPDPEVGQPSPTGDPGQGVG